MIIRLFCSLSSGFAMSESRYGTFGMSYAVNGSGYGMS
ncbi:hypothetical protein BH10ACI3_BH10ACI3_15440 [soil metagenome]